MRASRGPTAFSLSPASWPAERKVSPSTTTAAAIASSIAAVRWSWASRSNGSAVAGSAVSAWSSASRACLTDCEMVVVTGSGLAFTN